MEWKSKEFADLLEGWEEEGALEGDFTELSLTEGVRLFCQRLRKKGAYIPKGK